LPKNLAPVVRQAPDGDREIVMMSWGFMLLQKERRRGPSPTCDDKILTSSFSKSSFEERHCLVPASSFCEPNGDVKPADACRLTPVSVRHSVE
jgi:gamma-glutamylcyclotransferase